MFGLLDYRAAKLFLILFIIPNFILRVILVFGVPFISYELTKDFIYGEDYPSVGQILIFLGFFAISTIIAEIINIFLYEKVFKFIFTLLVDIIPSEGRSEEQALAVAYGGLAGRDLHNFYSKVVCELTDDDIEKVIKHLSPFFKDRARKRLVLLRDFYEENYPEATGFSHADTSSLEDIYKKNDCHLTTFEKIWTNKQYRNFLYQILFVIYFANEINSDGLFNIILCILVLGGTYYVTLKFQSEFTRFTKKLKSLIPKKFETNKKEDNEEEKSFNWFVGIIIFVIIYNVFESLFV